MKNFFYKYWWIILILILIPIELIFVFAFMEFYFHRIDLKAGEWATLFGTILVYSGTVLLGFLTLWQNDKLSKANERLLKLEKNRDRPFIKPFVKIHRLSLENSISNSITFEFLFKNIGKGFSIDTCFFAPNLYKDNTGEIIDSKDEYDNIFLSVGDEIELKFLFNDVNLLNSGNWNFCMNIHTEDINSIETKQAVTIPFEIIETKIIFKNALYISKEYCDYDIENTLDN